MQHRPSAPSPSAIWLWPLLASPRPRARPRAASRKYDSGYQKRRKKQRVDELIESQRGAMERFIRKEPPVNQTLDQGTIQNTNVPNDGETETRVENIPPTLEENIKEVPNNGDNMDGTSIDWFFGSIDLGGSVFFTFCGGHMFLGECLS
ncbi:modifier of rudimentary protein [Striga asiatica]|uniref:Modifier of rudimentary protein n=1 Tax=Striga asiatica TaxID=4170 RepID=A0A5A7RI80_STRAF|nr:modifier of rudimentary protein [Striga asiatica]